MFYPFLCGAFHQQEEEDDVLWSSPVSSSPRRSWRRKKDGNKNPYSTRGLDQFSALLPELEEKRQQIYSQMGTEGVVRFVYKNSNDCVPIVVTLKDQKKGEKDIPGNGKVHQPAEIKAVSEVVNKPQTPKPPLESEKQLEKKRKSFPWNVKSGSWRRPSYYVPAVIILILLLLVCFGRSVVILFTCVMWYMVPVISGEEVSDLRTSMKKKDLARKLSGNEWGSGKLSSPKSGNKFGAARAKDKTQ